MLTIRMLPARQGDALWITWDHAGAMHQMIIDMGTEEIGRALHDRLSALPIDQRAFELLVVTHVDRDHIGGVLTCLAEAEPLEGLRFEDVWFNGWQHLLPPKPAASGAFEKWGPAQGERLARWLETQRWNDCFDGGPVCRAGAEPPRVTLHGLEITVLGPTPERLSELRPVWKEEVELALHKGSLEEASTAFEAFGPKTRPSLETMGDLEELADKRTGKDPSEANGSSIALLLSYGDRRVLLSGDAFAEDLVEAIAAVSPEGPLRLDAFKLPHHGSKNNVTKALARAVECDRFLVSTDGTQFRHPDPEAMARVIAGSRVRPARLAFNVRRTYSGWWDDPEWMERFDYEVEYGSDDDGLLVVIEE